LQAPSRGQQHIIAAEAGLIKTHNVLHLYQHACTKKHQTIRVGYHCALHGQCHALHQSETTGSHSKDVSCMVTVAPSCLATDRAKCTWEWADGQ
jgi:hypothetical protein